jgi:hypothetical protein
MMREKITLGWRGKAAPVPDFVAVDEPAPSLSTVRAAAPAPQLRVDPWTQPEPLDYCLDCWKEWMAGDADRDLGAKTMRGLVGDEDGYGVDLHESQQSRDRRIGAATDAMIESLSRLHFWAIYKSCSIDTAWRFPNADLIETAMEARDALTGKLKNNSCTGILF